MLSSWLRALGVVLGGAAWLAVVVALGLVNGWLALVAVALTPLAWLLPYVAGCNRSNERLPVVGVVGSIVAIVVILGGLAFAFRHLVSFQALRRPPVIVKDPLAGAKQVSVVARMVDPKGTFDVYWLVDRGPKAKRRFLGSKTSARCEECGFLARTVILRAPSDAPTSAIGPNVRVEVRGIPQGSFLSALDATRVTTARFVNADSIGWRQPNVDEGIGFAYMPAPSQHLRPILGPFIGASGWREGLLIGVATVLPALLLILSTSLKDSVSATLKRALGLQDGDSSDTSQAGGADPKPESEAQQADGKS